MRTASSIKRTPAALAAAACILLALAGAHSAPADVVLPSVTLGPTTVLNGVATVSGTVTSPSPASAELTINGQPLGVNAAGQFTGVASLNGQSALSLAIRNPATGDVSTVTIPLTANLVGPGGVVSPEALAAIEQAALSIVKPVGGFVSVGDPISVSGSLGNGEQLAGLSVNGADGLSTLRPDGTFAVPVPGTTREISVLMTDKQGVSLETRYPVSQLAYVSAANAVGVRIASIRYFAKHVRTTKRLRMIVTIKDRRGVLVHGASVTVRSTRTGRIVGRAKLKRTNKKGQVGFVLRLRRAAFGKRVVFVTTAKTPKAKAAKRTSVRLPRFAAGPR